MTSTTAFSLSLFLKLFIEEISFDLEPAAVTYAVKVVRCVPKLQGFTEHPLLPETFALDSTS